MEIESKDIREKLSRYRQIKKVSLLILVLIVLMALYFFYVSYKQKQDALDRGLGIDAILNIGAIDDHISNGDYLDAAKTSKQHQKEFPEDSFGYLSEAFAYIQYGILTSDHEKYAVITEELINKALELNPNNHLAYRAMGDLRKFSDRHEEALAMYSKAIELNPEDSASYDSRGHLYFIIGNDVLAKSDYLKALDLDFKNANALSNIALLYIRNGEFETIDVEEIINRAIELEKNKTSLAVTYNTLGVLYITTERYEEAIPVFEKSVELDPFMTPAWNGIALSAYHIMRTTDISEERFYELFSLATDSVRTALETDPNFSRGYMTLGYLYIFGPDVHLGAEQYKKALEVVDADKTIGVLEKQALKDLANQLIDKINEHMNKN